MNRLICIFLCCASTVAVTMQDLIPLNKTTLRKNKKPFVDEKKYNAPDSLRRFAIVQTVQTGSMSKTSPIAIPAKNKTGRVVIQKKITQSCPEPRTIQYTDATNTVSLLERQLDFSVSLFNKKQERTLSCSPDQYNYYVLFKGIMNTFADLITCIVANAENQQPLGLTPLFNTIDMSHVVRHAHDYDAQEMQKLMARNYYKDLAQLNPTLQLKI